MHLILAALSLASTVPALYLGMKGVVAFDLPFVAGFIPVYVSIGLTWFFLGKAERSL